MKATAISLVPPNAAENNVKATPEILAAALAKYSRSTQGVESILATVDWTNPDKYVEGIFRFIDYGHASIGGLTGGIPVCLDGASLLLLYKIFELAQLCDGQESSTRYILLDVNGLCTPEELGVPEHLHQEWNKVMNSAFAEYQKEYERLDKIARENPEIARIPDVAPKVKERMLKNYALDRARYYLPLALKSNGGFIMTARIWAEVIKSLDSYEFPEFKNAASMIRSEVAKYAPRLMKHSYADAASLAQTRHLIASSKAHVSIEPLGDKTEVFVDNRLPSFMPSTQSIEDAIEGKTNRYSQVGEALKRTTVRVAWNNIAMAELRDLNRHRTGNRFTTLAHNGFYSPPEIEVNKELLNDYKVLLEKLQDCFWAPYGYLLGAQVAFEHSTHLDKMVYEIELRTGMGAHFRYAEHLRNVAFELFKEMPELEKIVQIGLAEPE